MAFVYKHSKMSTYNTERSNPGNLQYERFLHLRENFMCTLHVYTGMLLSVTVQDGESTVQSIEQNVSL